jgi:CRP/FNR family transcriptional regulator, dissimilatory nitrate respiration regulator
MTREEILTGLRQIPLFSELSNEDLEIMSKSTSAVHMPKGTVIFRNEDDYYGFYVVLSGAVKVYKLTPDGKETILHLILPFQTLAEIPMFAGGGYPAYAETLEDSQLLCIYKEGFLDLIKTHSELAMKMLGGLSKRLKVMGAQLEKLNAHDVKTRLAQFIIEEYSRQKHLYEIPVIELPLSKTLLAAKLGTILETLSRAFKKLEGENLIRVSAKKVFIEDLGRLRNYGNQ